MVGLQTLDLAIGVRVPASQPNLFFFPAFFSSFVHSLNLPWHHFAILSFPPILLLSYSVV